MARNRRKEADQSGRHHSAMSWVRLGLVLLLALPALGVKPHRADLNVSARVVRHAAVVVNAAPTTAMRATVRRPVEANPTVLAVQSNGPTRRVEHSMRPARVDGQSTRRRVVTILTP